MGVLSAVTSSATAKDAPEEYTTIRAAIVCSRPSATPFWADDASTTTRSVSTEQWLNKLNGQIPSQRSASQRLLFNLHRRPHLIRLVKALATINNGSWTTLRISVIYALQETPSLQSEGG